MGKIRSFLKSDKGLLILSAFLSALPMTFPELFFLAWVAFIPFFWLVLKSSDEKGAFRAFFRGAAFGFFYYAFIYFWFLWLYPLSFAGLDHAASLAVVLLAWIGISLVHGIFFGLPTLGCYFAAKKIRKTSFLLFLCATLVLLSQRMTEFSQLAFPWVRVSLGQYRAPVLIQSAEFFGIEGVDFLILSFSALLTYTLWEKEKRKRMVGLLLACALFFANLVYGIFAVSRDRGEESISVAAVQGSILSGEKWSNASSSLETYVSLTEESVQEDCDLVIWPESAVTSNLKTNPDLLSYFQTLSEKISTPILMGCFYKKDAQSTNSALLITSTSVSEPYSKRHLVPFGERMPYRAFFETVAPFLGEINMLSSDLAAGDGSALMELDGRKIGSIICFESLFPDLVRESVSDGAEMIVLVTNDSWYEDSPAVWQHLAHAVFRSVENRRSTVRCANSGVSALIDENGVITEELGPLVKGVVKGEVSFCSENTLFCRWGSWVFPTACGISLLWGLILLFRERRRKNG